MSGRLSRAQKRKKKLAQRRQVTGGGVQPYEGRKYESEEFALALFGAESAILECYVLCSRRLTDYQVIQSLEYLVRDLQGRKPPEPPEDNPLVVRQGQECDDLVATRIQDKWEELIATQPRHSNADLAGILRKILSSIRVRTGAPPSSQRYLTFLEGFLGQMGVGVEEVEELPD